MADNPVKYGFRWIKSRSGSGNPDLRRGWVATGASFDVNGGAANVYLGEGDPIIQVSDGSVTLALGSETTDSSPILGVCVGIKQYYDTAKGVMTAMGPGIPSDLAWGTDLRKQSQLLFVPAQAGVWAIQVDDSVTATTEAAYQAFIGENCRMVLTGTSGQLRAFPKLDISAHATTNTFVWKIVNVPTGQDFSGNNVEVHVICNLATDNAALGV